MIPLLVWSSAKGGEVVEVVDNDDPGFAGKFSWPKPNGGSGFRLTETETD